MLNTQEENLTHDGYYSHHHAFLKKYYQVFLCPQTNQHPRCQNRCWEGTAEAPDTEQGSPQGCGQRVPIPSPLRDLQSPAATSFRTPGLNTLLSLSGCRVSGAPHNPIPSPLLPLHQGQEPQQPLTFLFLLPRHPSLPVPPPFSCPSHHLSPPTLPSSRHFPAPLTAPRPPFLSPSAPLPAPPRPGPAHRSRT